jgi:hypothetical protein
MSGKVVVARSMSLDGFIAGPGDTQDWVFYSSAGLARIDLEPVSTTRSGAVTILRFSVPKQSSA